MTDAAAGASAPGRIAALDLIRGIAVLGILAVNLAVFAGPAANAITPDALRPAGNADIASYLAVLVLFEGKMRALFSILFGASLILFVDRADDAGRDGAILQLRRLGWLGLLGWLHWLLLWNGDILLCYAIAGIVAMMLRGLANRGLIAAALVLFAAWQAHGTAGWLPVARAELAEHNGTADATARALLAKARQDSAVRMARDTATLEAGFTAGASQRLRERPFEHLTAALAWIGESIAYMLIGIALMRSGFFAGGWSARRLRLLAAAGIGVGGAATLAFSGWGGASGFPYFPMLTGIAYLMGFPHLLMALGYAAALMLCAPALLSSAIGGRIAAAGRMALSNYLGCTIVMCALFFDWGLGLHRSVSWAAYPLFIALGWALILGWSAPWLARFRQGPFEWLWRSLTEARMLQFRRS